MPVVVDSYEPDGDGGYYIQWSDPSQPVTAFIHATPDLMDEFVTHHRKGRGAPTVQLDAARDGMHNPSLPDAATVQLFALAYDELIDDIKDLKARGLRHNTPYEVHQAVKGGGVPDRVWLRDQTPDGFRQFIKSRDEA